MADCEALNSKSRKVFYQKIQEYFGVPTEFKLDGIIFKNYKNKHYLLSNKFADVVDAGYNSRVLGLYIAEISEYNEIRLSIEGSQLIGPVATKHLLELSPEQKERFIRGDDLDIATQIQEQELKNHFYILYYTDKYAMKNYIGTAKIKNGQLFNYTPKARRVRDGE